MAANDSTLWDGRRRRENPTHAAAAAAHVCGGYVTFFFFSKLRRVSALPFSFSPLSSLHLLSSVCFEIFFFFFFFHFPISSTFIFQRRRLINKRLRRRRRRQSLNALEGEKESVKRELNLFKGYCRRPKGVTTPPSTTSVWWKRNCYNLIKTTRCLHTLVLTSSSSAVRSFHFLDQCWPFIGTGNSKCCCCVLVQWCGTTRTHAQTKSYKNRSL